MADDINLKVVGQALRGWKSVSVTRGIDALAGPFSLGLSHRWPGAPADWGIQGDDACEVLIGDEKVMTGWIDTPVHSIDPRRHPFTVSGAAKTVDLIDCSAIHTPGSWKNRKLEQIAADLTAPFGIKVKAVASTGAAFPTFALQQGEKVFDAINRMARQRGVTAVTTIDGDLEFIQPGKTAAGYSLIEGENFEVATFTDNRTQRFSEYLLKGYSADGKTRPKATAKDEGVRRHRPLLIVHDDDSTPGNLSDRAKYEATRRAGEGKELVVTVSSWRARNGQLYAPDRLVPVKAPSIGVEGELLIKSVTYLRDAVSGTRAELMLSPKEAFSLMPIPAPAKRSKKRRST
ncbi:MAG: hypothetical protein GC145_14345 [Caulobacter sp.]|nr:hypothetical protein [Caulobacter sp.]